MFSSPTSDGRPTHPSFHPSLLCLSLSSLPRFSSSFLALLHSLLQVVLCSQQTSQLQSVHFSWFNNTEQVSCGYLDRCVCGTHTYASAQREGPPCTLLGQQINKCACVSWAVTMATVSASLSLSHSFSLSHPHAVSHPD